MKRSILVTRWMMAALCAAMASACGVKGPLERPAPLWGEASGELKRPVDTRDQDVPLNTVILSNEIFAEDEDGEDDAPELLGGPSDGSE